MMTLFDDRRDVITFDGMEKAIAFSVEHFVKAACEAIAARNVFTVALSGGSTPKAIFQLLTSPLFRDRIDWNKVKLFWSDERAVSPDSPDSNYHMAMEAGFATIPIPPENIFRMAAESLDIEKAAKEYENLIVKNVPNQSFDLVMLGMGEDGHTASLFPKTHALHSEERLVVANFIPQKNTWRMTLTFECINNAHAIAIYVIGASKAAMLQRIFNSPYEPDLLPIQRVGTAAHKALWITDQKIC